MGLEVAAQLALDGAAFVGRRAPSLPDSGELAALLDLIEQRLARRNRRENQRHAVGKRALDVLHRAGPLDLAKGRMDDEELFAGNDAGQHDRHRLRVLAARGIDYDQGTGADHLLAPGRHGDIGEVDGHGSVSRVAVRGPLPGPAIRPEDAALHLLPSHRPLAPGWALSMPGWGRRP